MAAVVIVVIVIAVFAGTMLMVGSRRRESSVKRAQQQRAQQLCGGTVYPDSIRRVTVATAQLTDDGAAAARLGHLACALFSVQMPDGGQTDLSQHLRSVENRLVHVDHAVDVYEKAAVGLDALAAEAESAGNWESAPTERLTAALADPTCLPVDAGVDALAQVVGRYAAHAAAKEGRAGVEEAAAGQEVGVAVGAAKRVAAATCPADLHAAAREALLADMDRELPHRSRTGDPPVLAGARGSGI